MSLKDLQNRDKNIRFILDALSDKNTLSFRDISGKNVVIRSLWSQRDILEIRDGVLYRRFETSDIHKNRLQAIVPFSERQNALSVS